MKPQNTSAFFKNITSGLLTISVALVIYPAAVLSVRNVNGLIFGLLVLAGLASIFSNRKKSLQVNQEEKLYYFSITCFFSIALLVTLNAGFVYKEIGKLLHLLLAIPVYIYLRSTRIKLSYLWYGLVLGSIIAVGIAIYEVWIGYSDRARSITHPIIFGDLALAMGCMSLAGIGWFKQRSNWLVLLPVVAFLCSLLVTALASARGSWVAIPFVLFIFFWFMTSYFSSRQKISIAVFFAVVMGAIYLVPQTQVSQNIDRTFSNLKLYSESDVTSDLRVNSVGIRLELWQAAWKMFVDNPVLGVGWGHYNENVHKQVDQGLLNPAVAKYPYPHSQYFSALASGGVVGFIAILILFLVPVWIFIKQIKLSKNKEVRRLALAGLILVVSYMAFGFSETILERSRPVNFFAFYLAVFMAAIYGQKNKEVVTHNHKS